MREGHPPEKLESGFFLLLNGHGRDMLGWQTTQGGHLLLPRLVVGRYIAMEWLNRLKIGNTQGRKYVHHKPS